jgi:uncharacterized protein YqgV (UPF0045/DUF77 family)
MSIMTCEASVYPLDVADSSATVARILKEMDWQGLELTVGPMSTFIRGREELVLARVQGLYRAAADAGPCVLHLTLSNTCGCRAEG